MLLLAASLGALLIGPVLLTRLHPGGRALSAVDGFVLTATGGLILMHVLPESVLEGGLLAVFAGLLGLIVPAIHASAPQSVRRLLGPVAASLVFIAAFLHAAMDGLALRTSESGDVMLGLAVVLHRLPVGIGLAWLAQTRLGRRTAFWGLAIEAFGSIFGYFAGDLVLGALSAESIAVMQAFMGGFLLHVLVGHAPIRATPGVSHTVGGVLGAAVVVGLFLHEPLEHLPGEASFPAAFLALARAAAPGIFLGLALVVAAAIITARWPRLARRADVLTAGIMVSALAFSLLGPWPCLALAVGSSLIWGIGVVAPDAPDTPAPTHGGTKGRFLLRTPVDAPLIDLASASAGSNGGGATADPIWRSVSRGVALANGFAPAVLLYLTLGALLEPVLPELPGRYEVILAVVFAAPRPLSVRAGGTVALAFVGAILLHKGAGVGMVVAYALAGLTSIDALSPRSRFACSGVAALAGVLVAVLVPNASAGLELHQSDAALSVREGIPLVVLAAALLWPALRLGPREWLRRAVS